MLPLYHSTDSFNRLLFGKNEGLRKERGWVGNIVRELLNDAVHLPDEEASNSLSCPFTGFPA